MKSRSDILMHRSCAYEVLGLLEMCSRDMTMIAKSDPGFRLRYLEESSRMEKEGMTLKAHKIKQFLAKMERLAR